MLNPELEDYCKTIARSLGTVGPINVQTILSRKEIHVIEINPESRLHFFFRWITTTPVSQVTHNQYSLAPPYRVPSLPMAYHSYAAEFVNLRLSPAARCYPRPCKQIVRADVYIWSIPARGVTPARLSYYRAWILLHGIRPNLFHPHSLNISAGIIQPSSFAAWAYQLTGVINNPAQNEWRKMPGMSARLCKPFIMLFPARYLCLKKATNKASVLLLQTPWVPVYEDFSEKRCKAAGL